MSTPSIVLDSAILTSSQAVEIPIARPTNFLSLAPVQSASYPRSQPPTPAATKSGDAPILSPALASPPKNGTGPSADEIAAVLKARRSSSVSSDGSEKKRFLKLGPVFWGGEPGVGDWAEEE